MPLPISLARLSGMIHVMLEGPAVTNRSLVFLYILNTVYLPRRSWKSKWSVDELIVFFVADSALLLRGLRF